MQDLATSFLNFQGILSSEENRQASPSKGGKNMCGNSYSCHGTGVFLMGAVAGMAAGAAMNAMMTPSSSRQIKRTAHKAARRVNEAIDHLADAMDL
jgi:hypothetical protein